MDASADNPPFGWRLPDACLRLARELYAASLAESWKLAFPAFQAALERSAARRFPGQPASAARVSEYLSTLHTKDLALACACAEGSEPAWNEFVAQYRGYLRASAGAILRKPASDPVAIELADSLFSDLFGLSGTSAARRSLFRYFHGRSSLKTWLRAVLAQRHIDSVRAAKKFESLDATGDKDGPRRAPEPAVLETPSDPHRALYVQRFREALSAAMGSLAPRDAQRLCLYYAEDRTLAEIGRLAGEHESSVSRNLERIRRELRATIEGLLRAGKGAANGGPAAAGMDDAQIALCIQYAAEDASIDFDQLFQPRQAEQLESKKPPPVDRSLEP